MGPFYVFFFNDGDCHIIDGLPSFQYLQKRTKSSDLLNENIWWKIFISIILINLREFSVFLDKSIKEISVLFIYMTELVIYWNVLGGHILVHILNILYISRFLRPFIIPKYGPSPHSWTATQSERNGFAQLRP